MSKEDRKRAGFRQAAALSTAYGIGLLGAGVFEPLAKGSRLTWVSLGCVVAGLLLNGASVYFAIRGEKEDDK